MASHNKIMLIGAVQDTPDVKATTSGHALAKFTLKVPRIESLPNEAFDFIRIVAWREDELMPVPNSKKMTQFTLRGAF